LWVDGKNVYEKEGSGRNLATGRLRRKTMSPGRREGFGKDVKDKGAKGRILPETDRVGYLWREKIHGFEG